MATLVPCIDPQIIHPVSERQVVLSLLKQLPENCYLYHSFEILSSETRKVHGGGQRLQEAEIDALVLWPEHGLLVLEIKGGEIRYSGLDHGWTSKSRNGATHSIKDPFTQARGNMHKLVKSISAELHCSPGDLSVTRGYAVVFPGCHYDGALPHNADKSIVCDASKLDSIGEFIESALRNWKRSGNTPGHKEIQFSRLRKAVSPAFNLIPSLHSRIQNESAEFLRLTEEQQRFLDFASRTKRAKIHGVAGSGKTMLAIEQARRYAKQDKNTLMLCYNTTLAGWIRDRLDDEDRRHIRIHTFHEWCASACRKSGIDFEPDQDDQDHFWNVTAAELLLDSTDTADLKFDAIVVDEGQDFRSEWWLALEACLKVGGDLFVFYDEEQDIFDANGIDSLENMQEFLLPTNCRNTQEIASFCSAILQSDKPTNLGTPEGLPVELVFDESAASRKKKIELLINHWISKEKLQASQIAILSPFRQSKTCLKEVASIAGVPLIQNAREWQANKGILQSTIKGFKGLEADVLLLIDVPKPDSRKVFMSADYYVGCSRAKSVLFILARDAAWVELKRVS